MVNRKLFRRKNYFGRRLSIPNPNPNPKAIDPNGKKVTELRLDLAGSGTRITFLELLITESRPWIAGSWSVDPSFTLRRQLKSLSLSNLMLPSHRSKAHRTKQQGESLSFLFISFNTGFTERR
nr:hypothetical protein CFP56_53171 [Quercus suber]